MALTKPQNSHTSQSATGDILQPITGRVGQGEEGAIVSTVASAIHIHEFGEQNF